MLANHAPPIRAICPVPWAGCVCGGPTLLRESGATLTTEDPCEGYPDPCMLSTMALVWAAPHQAVQEGLKPGCADPSGGRSWEQALEGRHNADCRDIKVWGGDPQKAPCSVFNS